MIVNPDVDVYRLLAKKTKKAEKQQLTENQNNAKYQNVSWGRPVLTSSLLGSGSLSCLSSVTPLIQTHLKLLTQIFC